MMKAQLISWGAQLGVFAVKQLVKVYQDKEKQEALKAKAHQMNQARLKAYRDAAAKAQEKANTVASEVESSVSSNK